MSQVPVPNALEYHTIPFNRDTVSVQRWKCWFMLSNGQLSFLISENAGLCSCAQTLLPDYTEEKRGHGHTSSSHLLFILLGEARRGYSCTQRKQAWPPRQMATELSKVIMQLGEYKAFLSESCSSFPWLKYESEFPSPFVTIASTSKELLLHIKSQIFPLNEWLTITRAWDKNQRKEKSMFMGFVPAEWV